MVKKLPLLLWISITVAPGLLYAQKYKQILPQLPGFNLRKDIYISPLDLKQKKLLLYIAQQPTLGQGLEQVQMESKRLNPAKYTILLHGAKGVIPILLNNTFHSEWKLYLKKTRHSSLKFTTGRFYETWGTGKINVLFDKNLNKALWKMQSGLNPNILQWPDNLHFPANGFANCWLIDTRALTDILPKKDIAPFFVQNNKGIDLELILEFRGQKPLYLGLIISLGTFCILVGFLLLSKRTNPAKSKAEQPDHM